ncbi:MAG: redox-regulated ATPase YchF [Spirochaetales bacterium]|nr:redox-regulated ATPase YchF [Spirochaetales bacterium]
MQAGLVGAAGCGKTTLFELLSSTTGSFLAPDKANTATVDVPDERIDLLSALYRPRKTTYAQISFTDINRLSEGERENNDKALCHLKLMDALAVVVNGFLPGRSAETLIAEIEFCLTELILSDLEQVERKLERLEKSHKPAAIGGIPEKELFQKLAAALEAHTPLKAVELPDAAWKELSSFAFLTRKPLFCVLNCAEEEHTLSRDTLDGFRQSLAEKDIELVCVHAKLEKDLQELDPGERGLYSAEYDFPLNGKEEFIRQAYRTAGLASFFTVGEDEVRAWTVKQGCPCREAAAAIHNDLMHNFIRAEIISYEQLLECGSEQEASKRGWLRSEKKEYPVQDGDILHILANA